MDTNILIGIAGTIIGTLGLILAWHSYHRDKAQLRINLELTNSRGKFGIAIDNKDHLFVSALNTGRRAIVLKDVELDSSTPMKFWFTRPSYKPQRASDEFRGITTGGSFDEPRKIEPGFEFKMQIELSAGILVGHYILNDVRIPDTIGNIFKPSWLEMMLIKRQIKKQLSEWREKLSCKSSDKPHNKQSQSDA